MAVEAGQPPFWGRLKDAVHRPLLLLWVTGPDWLPSVPVVSRKSSQSVFENQAELPEELKLTSLTSVLLRQILRQNHPQSEDKQQTTDRQIDPYVGSGNGCDQDQQRPPGQSH